MKKNYFLIGWLMLCGGLLMTACSDDDSPLEQGGDTWTEKKDDVPAAQQLQSGFYVANEGWGGRDNGSVNYFKKEGDAYAISYRAFREANAGKETGVTTCFATVWGNSIYFVSKQGSRLVVADAETLKEKAAIENIGGGDGRMFLGLDDKRAYISTSNGVVKFDIANLQVGDAIEGINEEIGNLALSGNKVFAIAEKKLYIIDALTDQLLESVDGGFVTVTVSKDGMVWVAADDAFQVYNPATLTCETVNYPEGGKVYDSWFAWNANSLCASVQENVLYWISGSSSWLLNSIWKYDVETKEAKKICQFGKTANGQDYMIYGAGLRVNPLSDELIVTLSQSGFGVNYAHNWVRILDKNGQKLEEITLLGDNGTSGVEGGHYYWFQALPFFEDANPPQILLNQVMLKPGETVSVDLKEKVVDYDNTFVSMICELIAPENPVAEVSLHDGVLKIEAGEITGVSPYLLSVVSNGVRVQKNIEIVVADK